MNSVDGQVYSVSMQFSCFTKYNRMQSKHKQTKCEHEFPCILGHPVYDDRCMNKKKRKTKKFRNVKIFASVII